MGDLESKVQAQQHTFAVVVDLIEKFRLAKGGYPSRLDEVEDLVVPPVLLPERFNSLRTIPMSYEVSRERSFFRLAYGIYDSEDSNLHSSMSYLSLEKKWDITRNLKGFTHVQAAHYGNQYKTTLSWDYLTLAVQSLLDSAKSNSIYPCRNLWKNWVTDAIGSGVPMNHLLPKRVGNYDTVLYAAKNGQPAYAFEFQSRLYPPMTKPLMIVEAVYKTETLGKEWTLVQQCDASSSRPA
jgi:hypothetical protein